MQHPKHIPHKERDSRINSAVTAIKALVRLDLIQKHKKDLIDSCIWKITEADGKHNTRYRSYRSLRAAKKELRHEHVFERKKLVEEILKNPDNIDKITKKAIACLVTKNEHKKLSEVSHKNPKLVGWERYDKAHIKICDLKKPKDYK